MPAAERVMAERGLRPEQVEGSGPGGRILKEDVLRQAAEPAAQPAARSTQGGSREEEIVTMTRLRRTVAERLVAAHQNAALLTTFNEVDMSAVMSLRKEFGEQFLQKYSTKLGFMSFFVKACVDGLRQFPAINAEIRDQNIVYHNYCDIGVAIGGGKRDRSVATCRRSRINGRGGTVIEPVVLDRSRCRLGTERASGESNCSEIHRAACCVRNVSGNVANHRAPVECSGSCHCDIGEIDVGDTLKC